MKFGAAESRGRDHAYEIRGTAGTARDFSVDTANGFRHAGAEFVLQAGTYQSLAGIT